MNAGFRYPLLPCPRLAGFGVVLPGWPHLAESEPFDPARFDAESVVLPARLLPCVWAGVWTPQFPVVILTGPLHGAMRPEDRDEVWDRWGVPVYEQLTDQEGRIIAEECDAHDGLHLRPDVRVAGSTVEGMCPCGVAGPRLLQGCQQPVAAP